MSGDDFRDDGWRPNLAHVKPYEHFHGGQSRPDVVRALYRKWSREGQTRAWMLKNITNMDGKVDSEEYGWMDDHVKQMMYQMVRHLARVAPHFNTMLDLIERVSGRSQESVLEHIRKQLWAKMQQIDDDRSHTELYKKVQSLYFTYERQLQDASSNAETAPRRQPSVFGAGRRVRRQRPNAVEYELWHALDEEKQALEEDAIVPEMWAALDEEADHERQQKEWLDGVSAWYRRHD